MTETNPEPTRATPWHLWVVGIIGVLWSAMGAFDFLMTQTKADWYMKAFTPEQLEFFYGYPGWLVAFWAVGVWGGVIGSILLLLKRSLAVPVYLASWLSVGVVNIYIYGFTDSYELMEGDAGAIFSALIFLVAVGLWYYASAITKKGLLQ